MFSRCECNRWNLAWSAAVPVCFVCSALTRLAWCGCRALKSSQHPLCSLLIVDTPGFQNPRLAKRECGATFEDLCHNYTQERLHSLFYQRTFVQELERYKEVPFFFSPCLPPLFQSLSLPPNIILPAALSQMYRPPLRLLISLAVPPTCHQPRQAGFKRPARSLAMPVFTSSIQIKVELLTTDGHWEQRTQLHRRLRCSQKEGAIFLLPTF